MIFKTSGSSILDSLGAIRTMLPVILTVKPFLTKLTDSFLSYRVFDGD